jgi:hypothetical protein
MTPMVQGAFAFSIETLTQRWSWGRVMSRPSGGTWQRRWPGARKLGPAQTHKSLWAGTGANHSLSLPKTSSAGIDDAGRLRSRHCDLCAALSPPTRIVRYRRSGRPKASTPDPRSALGVSYWVLNRQNSPSISLLAGNLPREWFAMDCAHSQPYLPCPAWAQLTLGFMSANGPRGFAFHAHTCSS